jgi:hypothetical protein
MKFNPDQIHRSFADSASASSRSADREAKLSMEYSMAFSAKQQ